MPNSRALQFIVIFWVGMISLVSPTLSILDRIELANVFRAIIVTVVVMASFFLRMKPPVRKVTLERNLFILFLFTVFFSYFLNSRSLICRGIG